jgi:hypothetical protein
MRRAIFPLEYSISLCSSPQGIFVQAGCKLAKNIACQEKGERAKRLLLEVITSSNYYNKYVSPCPWMSTNNNATTKH